MDQQTVKTEPETPETPSLLVVQPSCNTSVESMMVTVDDITRQNQTAQLFFEALLQSSRTQIHSDNGLPTSGIQTWAGIQGAQSLEGHMIENSVVTRQSPSPIISETDSLTSVSPQISVTVKQSASPVTSIPPQKKRSRRQTGGSTVEGLDGHVIDTYVDSVVSDGANRECAVERSVSESGSETITTPRRRGSQLSDCGRRSRTQSESENDFMSESLPVLGSYALDDTRRQMTGSVTPETDVGFQPSMLDAVLTEKKMALLRSPEVRQFLQQQQAQRAKERKLTHSSPSVGSKGDNP